MWDREEWSYIRDTLVSKGLKRPDATIMDLLGTVSYPWINCTQDTYVCTCVRTHSLTYKGESRSPIVCSPQCTT